MMAYEKFSEYNSNCHLLLRSLQIPTQSMAHLLYKTLSASQDDDGEKNKTLICGRRMAAGPDEEAPAGRLIILRETNCSVPRKDATRAAAIANLSPLTVDRRQRSVGVNIFLVRFWIRRWLSKVLRSPLCCVSVIAYVRSYAWMNVVVVVVGVC